MKVDNSMSYNQYAHVHFDGSSKIYDYVIPQGMSVKAGDDVVVLVSDKPKVVKVVDVSFTSSYSNNIHKAIVSVVDREANRRAEQKIRLNAQMHERVQFLRHQEDLARFVQTDLQLAAMYVLSQKL
jgi:hypothetical protein